MSIQFILLEQRLKKLDMIDVFTIQLYGPSDPTDIEVTMQKNLLTHYAKLELADLRKTVCLYHVYGQEYDLENLQWSQELFKESCGPSLHDKVLEKLISSKLLKWVVLLSFLSWHRPSCH